MRPILKANPQLSDNLEIAMQNVFCPYETSLNQFIERLLATLDERFPEGLGLSDREERKAAAIARGATLVYGPEDQFEEETCSVIDFGSRRLAARPPSSAPFA